LLELVKLIHEALHTHSTVAFVLFVGSVFFVVGGGAAWIVDSSYKNSLAAAQVERRLTEWQRVKLISSLSRYKNQKAVILASEGVDTQFFASEFGEVLAESGWRVKGPIAAPKDAPAIDLQVSISNSYFGQAHPEASATLQGTLGFVGLRCRDSVGMDPNVPRDVIVLWVGANGKGTSGVYPPLSTKGVEVPSEF